MAQKGAQLDRANFSCSICLDLLKDPVALPCGHSYCMNCIEMYWGEKDDKKTPSCPQCRQAFSPRPALVKNIMLADLVEELKKAGLEAAADLCYAKPEDVACDYCAERKLKAIKSCLVCVASYCEKHLRLHHEAPQLKKHKLVEPSKKLRENACCSRHSEAMKIFCRTDQQPICHLCLMDKHKGHVTVPAAVERSEKQKLLEVSRRNIQQRIQDTEQDVRVLRHEVEAINLAADKAVNDSEKTFAEMIRLIQKLSSEVKQQLRSKQETEVGRVTEFQEKLEKEIVELQRRDAELRMLSHTEDHNEFLHNFSSISQLSFPTSSIDIYPLRYFGDMTAAVSKARDKLLDVLRKTRANISLTVTDVDGLMSQQEPTTRADFLRYSREITLDPNTAHKLLLLSKGNRKATRMERPLLYASHPDRFTDCRQVLSAESLTGRCYWEVEWKGGVNVAVAYKNISRVGGSNQCRFGLNDKSWVLDCYKKRFTFWFKNVKIPVHGPQSSRIGVYLDHGAGVLSFYSVSEAMTLLQRVKTTFTQPLYAGLDLDNEGDTAKFCQLE